jgi:Flp pilus assembly protein CpaB
MTGLLLILGSVALGGHLIGTASHTTAWVGVTRSLPAGHVLTAVDLRTVQAHLPASAGGRYFASAPAALVGKTLSSPVQAGELLTATALAKASAVESRVVPVVVHSGRLAALAAGDRVDVYVLSKSSGTVATANANGREVRVLSAAEFVSEEVLNSGDTSVQLRVAPQDAITVVAASQSGRVDLVRVDGADGAGKQPADTGPSSVSGFGGS